MSGRSVASQFRAERNGPFRISNPDRGWLVICHETWGWLHRRGFFIDFKGDQSLENLKAWEQACEEIYFPTEAEATFRLALYTDPAKALSAFLVATGGAYEGTCGRCEGAGEIESMGRDDQVDADGFREMEACPTCHGTGGPPSPEDLAEVSDWYSEREMELEASVLRSLSQGESK